MTGTAWAALGVALILAGLLALAKLRPGRGGLNSPQWMLLLGAAGMLAGMAADAYAGGLETVTSLCAASGGLVAMVLLHVTQLPLAHVGMIGGGLLVLPLMPKLRRGCRRQLCAQLGQNLVCSAWMVVGMAAGSVVFLDLAGWAQAVREPAAVLAGMFAGMVWGMVASVTLVQALVRLSLGPRPHAGGRP